MRRVIFAFLILPLLMSAPVQAENAQPARILAIGDSLMAWNRPGRRSIADIVGLVLKEPVENRATLGASFMYPLPISGAMGMKIARQYRGKPRDWVLISGGGNDLWLGCGCNKCDLRMQQMIAPNGRSGEIPQLVARIRSTGARVIMVGYLRSPGQDSSIEHCREEGDAYEARLAKMAKSMQGVWFISNADIVPHGDRSYHTNDMVHPSRKGSEAIGVRVVRLIKKLDKPR